MKTKLNIFLSYAHKDELMKAELDKALIGLKKNDKIDVWQDKELMPGQEWDQAIKDKLLAADIILLLISVDFNNSQYIWDKELAVAMQHHNEGKARVIPIILRPCDWSDMPYAKLQALPDGAVPVSTFEDQDVAYTNIAKKIKLVVDYMIKNNQ